VSNDESLERAIEAIVHDLNNYLAIISGRAALAVERAGEASRADLEAVTAAADAAAEVLARLASILPSVPTRLEQVEPSALLRDLEASLRAAAGDVTFELRVAPALPSVAVDAAQIERALIALIGNARAAMPSGGTVTVEAGTSEATVAIVVRDTGVGMEQDVLAHAAEPFFTTKARREGTGLGLSIARAIARRAGGELRIESAPGSGTAVSILLPATR
jgi:signal transduction histidine kinase